MKKVIIFGIGAFALEVFRYLQEEYEILGFCVDDKYYFDNKNILFGRKIYKLSDIESINKDDIFLITAIGYKNMRARKNIYLKLKKAGFKFISYIHKSVVLEKDVIIGENNIIFPGVIIGPGVVIKNNNIIHIKCVLCHDTRIGNHNYIASGVTIGGFCKILENNFIGFNSTIIQNINLEKEILIGAMSLVNKNPQNYTRNYGLPIREISSHLEEGIEI